MKKIKVSLLPSRLRSKEYQASLEKAKDAILEAHELRIAQERHASFLKRLQPKVEALVAKVKPLRSAVVLSNEDGVLLETIGDPLHLKENEKIYLQAGAVWAEEIHGTNSAGTVTKEKRPLEVVGKDHFLKSHHDIYCVGAPIFNSKGQLEGVLNVSGHKHYYDPSFLGLIDTLARTVENEILLDNHQDDVVIALQNNSLSSFEALVAIDQEGRINGFNRAAKEILPFDEAKETNIHINEICIEPERLLDQTLSSSLSFNILEMKGTTFSQSFLATVRQRPQSKHVFIPQKRSLSKERIPRNKKDRVFPNIFGNDPTFLRALHQAKKAAATNYPISITGESGTGKDLLSQAIHEASDRRDRPFIAINCGGLTKSLAESELFGYEAGAFTGAKKEGHSGVFERANGGTLFLDEIAELPLDIQAMLLRVLQDFKVRRIGGLEDLQVDVRIITATHTDLWKKVEEGSFREDLFYRLQGVNIDLPPLREREDRLQYAFYFLQEIQKELNLPHLAFSEEATNLIENYSWPGNIRQLKSALREAAFVAEEHKIELHDFPSYILQSAMNKQQKSSLLKDIENRAIIDTLKRTKGNISEAARILGIGRNTLYRKIKGLEHQLVSD